MKVLVQAMAVAGLIGSIAGAASAQTGGMDPAEMTCADFMAMSQEDQTAAMDAMAAADDMASDDMAADDMASDDMVAEDAMTSERMTAMMAACEGAPDMMAKDAMTSAMHN